MEQEISMVSPTAGSIHSQFVITILQAGRYNKLWLWWYNYFGIVLKLDKDKSGGKGSITSFYHLRREDLIIIVY
jgi:hypothetical protein